MLVILKKPVYFLSAFVKANCLFCFQVIHLNITSYVIDDLKMPEEEKPLDSYLYMEVPQFSDLSPEVCLEVYVFHL